MSNCQEDGQSLSGADLNLTGGVDLSLRLHLADELTAGELGNFDLERLDGAAVLGYLRRR